MMMATMLRDLAVPMMTVLLLFTKYYFVMIVWQW